MVLVRMYGSRRVRDRALRLTIPIGQSEMCWSQFRCIIKDVDTLASLNEMSSRSSLSSREVIILTPSSPVTIPCNLCSRIKYIRVTVGIWVSVFWTVYAFSQQAPVTKMSKTMEFQYPTTRIDHTFAILINPSPCVSIATSPSTASVPLRTFARFSLSSSTDA